MTGPGPIAQRVEYLLRLCDRDSDDVLEASDFEEWVDRLAALRGWEPGSDGYSALHKLYVEEAFGGIVAEVGRDDGRVPLGAMRDFLIAVAKDFAPEFRAWADVLFGVLDRDGDDVIGLEEHRDLLASLLVPRAVADVSFARIDVSGAGRVTRAQFRELYRGFFVVEDPDAPASWFWGRPPPLDEVAELRRARKVG